VAAGSSLLGPWRICGTQFRRFCRYRSPVAAHHLVQSLVGDAGGPLRTTGENVLKSGIVSAK
jgi:hypothetical protein